MRGDDASVGRLGMRWLAGFCALSLWACAGTLWQ